MRCHGHGSRVGKQKDPRSDLFTDGADGIEGGHRVLEDHRDLLSAYAKPLGLGGILGHILAVKSQLTAADTAVFIQHTEEGLGENGFTRAGFAHDGKRFALVNVE